MLGRRVAWPIARFVGWLGALACMVPVARWAFEFRLHAINNYGSVIHEFDPWFNFRATKYLVDNGWDDFFTWFDHRSW
eukprot:g2611.t1